MRPLKKLNMIALTLLIAGAIDSIRNFPTTAMFGGSIVFFFIFAAIVFLIPTALVSAELASNMEEGGIYQWARAAFGPRIAFLAVWLQWVNNIAWFPTILSFVAGTASYVFNPDLAQNKYYLITFVISSFWLLTLISLRGIRVSSLFTSACAIMGMILPILFLSVFLTLWFISGKPLQIHLNSFTSIFPDWHHPENWIALTAVVLSFFGMELATVHIKDVKHPQKTFPRALSLSCLLILATMLFGSLSIAYVIPGSEISLVNGTIQTFAAFTHAYHMQWLLPVITIMLICGCLGGIISWIVSPIKGVSQAAQDGFMPAFFKQLNRYGVAQNLMLTQAILVTLVCLTFLLFPSINGSYWFLSSLTTQLYVMMYFIMFLTALRLRKKITYKENRFVIPGEKMGLRLVCGLGLTGCTISLLVGFIPPSNMNIGSNLHYIALFCTGMIGAVAPILLFYWYQWRNTIISVQTAEAAV